MKYFTIEELCASDTARATGIKNEPTQEVKANLETLVDKILDEARERFGKPIKVNSGYRCKELNVMVGGSVTSQHMTGEAADITAKNKKQNKVLFEIIKQIGGYDQLIWEKGTDEFPQWIHVSIGKNPRGEVKRVR